MSGFTFSLGANTRLTENIRGCFLISDVPLRVIKVNRSLFRILSGLAEGGPPSEPGLRCLQASEERLLRNLLSLASRGYLRLEQTGEPNNFPEVSVIIPVKNATADIIECLQSLRGLDYPGNKLEIIIVEEGSGKEISDAMAAFDVKVISQDDPGGAAAARNIGVENARGEILAFVDADCIAGEKWLRETVPFFEICSLGAVGGFVDSYYKESPIDSYEEVSSSLNMGRRLLYSEEKSSNFYVPSCNLLVRREAFRATGGFRPGMPVGEDVDFCWRMRDLGYSLLYVPAGVIAHKHRNQLVKMLSRRKDYGTSEAPLYGTHRDKKKIFAVRVCPSLSFLALTAAVFSLNPLPLALILLFLGLDVFQKSAVLRSSGISLRLKEIIYSTLRSNLSASYFFFFHLVRYYLILLIGLGFWLPSFWLFGGLALLLTSVIDFLTRKPRLNYLSFLFYYTLEHIAYQAGVFWGCLKSRNFRAYLPVFTRT